MSEKKMTLLDTIQPKSDQLNYDDLIAGPMQIKVTGLAFGSPEQPVIVKCCNAATGEALRDYKPCKSMRRVLVAVWGDKGKGWIGQQAVLVGDDSVVFGGAKVGGIRISHVTGIDEPRTLMLTTTRSKRMGYVVKPLVVKDTPAQPTATEPAADDPARLM
jgi:hypothetical protein